MKIGILTSGNDMLSLFSFLHRYDHEYIVWYDDLFFSWSDKPWDLVQQRIEYGINFLKEKGVDFILVPPIVELSMGSKAPIFPLFEQYIMKYCFMYSLVGKIGFVGDWVDMQIGQQLLSNLAKTYVLTDHQRAIRKFQLPFAWRGKEVRNWKYLLDTLSWSSPLVNTLVKHGLKYFKDAGIDTLIPMNYAYFHVEKTIKKALYSKNMRFYGIKYLEQVFVDLVSKGGYPTSPYKVYVYHTGHGQFLSQDKRLMWLLGRGNSGEFLTVCKGL